MNRTTLSRSLVKAITFRTIMVFIGSAIAYVFTRDINISIGIFLVHSVIATLVYVIHERIWDRVGWGILHE